jgi:beta-glucanase (GH16 family)
MDGLKTLSRSLSISRINLFWWIVFMVTLSLIGTSCGMDGMSIELVESDEPLPTTLSPDAASTEATANDLMIASPTAREMTATPELTRSATPTETPTPKPTSTPTPTTVPKVIPAGQTGDWTLIFSDEFGDSELDPSKWTTCYWWGNGGCTISSNNEQEWYQPENVFIQDGNLLLRSQEEMIWGSDGRPYDYTSGMVTTGRDSSDLTNPTRFSFLYGYAEIRAKIPKGKGLWAAFWLLPDNNTSKPEIDVMEILGHEPSSVKMHFHYLNEDGDKNAPGNEWIGPDFSSDWHTYGIDWQPDMLTWYVDGIERWRFDDAKHIPETTMYLLMNLAVGGDWPGAPNDSTEFPSDYKIDYLRVWRRSGVEYLPPSEDAYVDGSSPTTNYGRGEELYSDGDPQKVSYLKFDTSKIQCAELVTAELRIRTLSSDGAETPDIHVVKVIEETDWQESTINFDNGPISTGAILGKVGDTQQNAVYDIPLNATLLRPYIGGEFTLLLSSTGTDGLYFHSRENLIGSPLLILEIDESGCEPNA